MKKVLTITAVILFVHGLTFCQEVILEKNVEEQYQESMWGPNLKHFGHVYIDLGMPVDYENQEGADINSWISGQFAIGYRYKLKLLEFYAIGLDLSYRQSQYRLEGDEKNPYDADNPLSMHTGEKWQWLDNYSFSLKVFQRINIGRRGNSLGNYLDIGLCGQWNMADIEVLIYKFDDPKYVGRQKMINSRLQFIEDFSYGINSRIGFKAISFYATYRLSDFFKEVYMMPELPRLWAGIEFVLGK